mmetsp:Transcript_42151/g.108561  ORF Transcript_42151/g.108561 Transcript_42151/m.108561 type:complete len:369 (+) Transcript_42151:1478-2584(+)
MLAVMRSANLDCTSRSMPSRLEKQDSRSPVISGRCGIHEMRRTRFTSARSTSTVATFFKSTLVLSPGGLCTVANIAWRWRIIRFHGDSMPAYIDGKEEEAGDVGDVTFAAGASPFSFFATSAAPVLLPSFSHFALLPSSSSRKGLILFTIVLRDRTAISVSLSKQKTLTSSSSAEQRGLEWATSVLISQIRDSSSVASLSTKTLSTLQLATTSRAAARCALSASAVSASTASSVDEGEKKRDENDERILFLSSSLPLPSFLFLLGSDGGRGLPLASTKSSIAVKEGGSTSKVWRWQIVDMMFFHPSLRHAPCLTTSKRVFSMSTAFPFGLAKAALAPLFHPSPLPLAMSLCRILQRVMTSLLNTSWRR